MLVNLKRPYGTGFSPRRTEDFIFFTDRIDDFLFGQGEEVVIYVAGVRRTLRPVFRLSRNAVKTPFYQGRAEGGNSYIWKIRIDSSMLTPGFYDLEIDSDQGNGNLSKGYCTFGYDIEHQSRPVARPEDFQAFWALSLKKLEGIDLDPICGERTVYRGKQIDDYNHTQASIPCNYDPEGCLYEEVESYEVSFQSVGGLRIHGWLAKPVTDEKLPVMLVLPGAGYAARSKPLEHARHGYLALDIQVHGQGVDDEIYSPTQVSIDYEDPAYGQEHYYNAIYLHCVQALNYLFSRDDIDKTRVVTVGGSQGGRLSLTTAALDNRVTAVVAGIVHYADIPYLQWANEVNSRGENGTEKPFHVEDVEKIRATSYYDVLSFAPDIKCPVLMNGGLIDAISLPGSIAAVYQHLGSKEKKLRYMANMAHDWDCQFDIDAWKWLKEVL